jgi:hypothetical protein
MGPLWIAWNQLCRDYGPLNVYFAVSKHYFLPVWQEKKLKRRKQSLYSTYLFIKYAQ